MNIKIAGFSFTQISCPFAGFETSSHKTTSVPLYEQVVTN